MKESFEWVKRCIESCRNPWQLRVANRMIEMFIDSFGKENTVQEADELYNVLVDKQAVIGELN